MKQGFKSLLIGLALLSCTEALAYGPYASVQAALNACSAPGNNWCYLNGDLRSYPVVGPTSTVYLLTCPDGYIRSDHCGVERGPFSTRYQLENANIPRSCGEVYLDGVLLKYAVCGPPNRTYYRTIKPGYIVFDHSQW